MQITTTPVPVPVRQRPRHIGRSNSADFEFEAGGPLTLPGIILSDAGRVSGYLKCRFPKLLVTLPAALSIRVSMGRAAADGGRPPDDPDGHGRPGPVTGTACT
jgi:hypothetical protein